MEPVPKGESLSQSTPKAWRSITPRVPDHELLRRIGEGSYGEVWLARNTVGTLRAVKVVYRDRFKDERPYEREFSGIQKYEPVSRTNEGLVDVLQIGRNDAEHYFYYVMELADDAGSIEPANKPAQRDSPSVESYVPRTLAQQIRLQRRLSVQECISLGLNLNLALGHLHRNGLIHRDVKPSNIIFVNGVPKLADIGLVTEMAEAESFVGTEGFIPPEGPNSPQADIYALGKVLYEASMAKDRREFPEPYSDLGTDSESHALMELNSVLLKACAPNPKQRYQSAEEMNADLALLHSGKSVQQKQQLERRLKLATRTGLALAAMLVLGAFPYGLALTQAKAARAAAQKEAEQKRIAVAEAAKSAQVAHLLQQMLEGAGPSVAKGRDTTILREILDGAAERLGKQLTNQPEVEIELRNTLGGVYDEIGLYTNAEAIERKALVLAESLGKETESLGDTLSNLGGILWHLQQLDEAELLLKRCVSLRKRLLGEHHPDLANALNSLACVFMDRGKFAESEELERTAVSIFKSAPGETDRALGASLDLLGVALLNQEKLDDAEKTLEEAVAFWKKVDGPDSQDLAASLGNYSQLLIHRGKLKDAEEKQKESLRIVRKVLGDHALTVAALMNLGSLLTRSERDDDALVLFNEALSMARRVLPPQHPLLADVIRLLAKLLVNQEKFDQAEPLMRESIAIFEKTAPEDPGRFFATGNLGFMYLKKKDFAKAEPLLLSSYEELKKREALLPIDGKELFRRSIDRLVHLYEATAKPVEAEKWRHTLEEFDRATPGAKEASKH